MPKKVRGAGDVQKRKTRRDYMRNRRAAITPQQKEQAAAKRSEQHRMIQASETQERQMINAAKKCERKAREIAKQLRHERAEMLEMQRQKQLLKNAERMIKSQVVEHGKKVKKGAKQTRVTRRKRTVEIIGKIKMIDEYSENLQIYKEHGLGLVKNEQEQITWNAELQVKRENEELSHEPSAEVLDQPSMSFTYNSNEHLQFPQLSLVPGCAANPILPTVSTVAPMQLFVNNSILPTMIAQTQTNTSNHHMLFPVYDGTHLTEHLPKFNKTKT